MPQAITPALTALLKSKLQAGPDGFRGEIEIDRPVSATPDGEIADLAFAVGAINAREAVESGDVVWAHATISGWFGGPVDDPVDAIPIANPPRAIDNNDGTASQAPAVVYRGDGVVGWYWEVDLGAPYEIVSFRGVTREGTHPTSIDYSDDGLTWTPAALAAYVDLGWTWYVDLAAPATHRLWRLRYTATVVGTIFGLSFSAGMDVYTWAIAGYGLTLARHVTETYQVASLSVDRSRKMAAAQLDVVLDNEDGSRGWYADSPAGSS